MTLDLVSLNSKIEVARPTVRVAISDLRSRAGFAVWGTLARSLQLAPESRVTRDVFFDLQYIFLGEFGFCRFGPMDMMLLLLSKECPY